MSGGFDAIADIGLGDVLSSAADLGSVVTDFGTEFVSSFDITSFEVPSFDVASLGGFDIAGSFAGSADWFNTFNPGSILDSIPSVSDFSLPSLPSLPSLGSLNVNNLVSSAASSFGIPPSITSTVTRTLSNPSLISAGAAALGINPAIALNASRVIGGASPISAGAAALGINPQLVSTATNLLNGGSPVAAGSAALGISPSTTSLITRGISAAGNVNPDISGINILSDAELAQVTRNVNPLFLNSLVDPAVGQPLNYNTAVEGRTALTPIIAEASNNIAIAQQNIASNNANIAAIEAELRDENLPDDRRQLLEEYLQANYENNSIQQYTITSNQEILSSATTNLAADQQIITNTNATATQSPAPVVDSSTPILVNQTTAGVSLGAINTSPVAVASPVNLGSVTATDLGLAVDPGPFAEGSSARNLVAEARAQQSARAVRNNKAESSDWRVRLRLAPNSTYLYNAPGNPGDPASGPGIMAPLAKTDGVIFPYTPAIDTAYKANYEAYDLTHSNYRGYFYKGSYVDAVNIRAQFTAQDTNEANYLLAVIHFFRSATKMFYGKDQQRGAPPPLVYLSGYGDYQFNEHPSVISQFNYTLPPDVDYIRAQNALDVNTNALGNRIRSPIANNPLSYTVNRLLNSNLLPGALDFRPNISNNLPVGSPTYVPTKMEISITLLPIQSRQQISKNFSVKTFAAGNLLKGGYW